MSNVSRLDLAICATGRLQTTSGAGSKSKQQINTMRMEFTFKNCNTATNPPASSVRRTEFTPWPCIDVYRPRKFEIRQRHLAQISLHYFGKLSGNFYSISMNVIDHVRRESWMTIVRTEKINQTKVHIPLYQYKQHNERALPELVHNGDEITRGSGYQGAFSGWPGPHSATILLSHSLLQDCEITRTVDIGRAPILRTDRHLVFVANSKMKVCKMWFVVFLGDQNCFRFPIVLWGGSFVSGIITSLLESDTGCVKYRPFGPLQVGILNAKSLKEIASIDNVSIAVSCGTTQSVPTIMRCG